jgi:hypothetical protein
MKCGCGKKKGAAGYGKGKPYNEKNDKPQDKEDTRNLTAKGKDAFDKADKKQPKSTKQTMKEDNAWDEKKIKQISKKPGMAKKK